MMPTIPDTTAVAPSQITPSLRITISFLLKHRRLSTPMLGSGCVRLVKVSRGACGGREPGLRSPARRQMPMRGGRIAAHNARTHAGRPGPADPGGPGLAHAGRARGTARELRRDVRRRGRARLPAAGRARRPGRQPRPRRSAVPALEPRLPARLRAVAADVRAGREPAL